MKENQEELLKHIDAEIEKWTSRKLWVQKCVLEGQVEELMQEVSSLREENFKFIKAASQKIVGSYSPNIPLNTIERNHILASLEFHDGDRHKAAADLDITIKELYNKLHEYGYFDAEKES